MGHRNLPSLGPVLVLVLALSACSDPHITALDPSVTASREIATTLAPTVERVMDLGTLPGGGSSFGAAINERGHVVGTAHAPAGSACCAPHAFFWSAARGMEDIGIPTGGSYSYASGLNNFGQVVGAADGTGGQTHAMMWTKVDGLWTSQDLGTLPGGNYSFAYAINDVGQVVGRSAVAVNGVCCSFHAFMWQDGLMTDLGALDGQDSFAFWVAADGHVVGRSSAGAQTHAVSWTTAAGILDLGTLGGSFSAAFGANASGEIVGYSGDGSGRERAFLWTSKRGMIDLGTLGGANSYAFGNNSRHQVVGRSETGFGEDHAFFWTIPTGMVDIGALPGSRFGEARSINRARRIAGYSLLASGEYRATLWILSAPK